MVTSITRAVMLSSCILAGGSLPAMADRLHRLEHSAGDIIHVLALLSRFANLVTQEAAIVLQLGDRLVFAADHLILAVNRRQ